MLERLVLWRSKREALVIPMRRDHKLRMAETGHQTLGISVDLQPWRGGCDEDDIRPKAFHLTLDVIHRAEEQHFPPCNAQQIRKRAAFDIFIQAERLLLHGDCAEILV